MASGASGDSNKIIEGLLAQEFSGRALAPVVDAPAVAAAAAAGVGATVRVAVGGTLDPGRFTPLPVEAEVVSLHEGSFTYENGTTGFAGQATLPPSYPCASAARAVGIWI